MQEIKKKASAHNLSTIRHVLSSRSGDTLVEVMASIVIFLLMMGILQGAVSYSGRALIKNQEIRKENSKILEGISDATPTKKGETSQTFRATDANLTAVGKDVFTVKTGLYTLSAEGVTFARYGTTDSSETEEESHTETGTDTGEAETDGGAGS